ncbi:4Fe-4S ferredoxin [Methanocaldococcus bathoardescens]|uniref:4Fe-4S ferredoxin n=1 Tax=Methanocaldococcus bathoardescens TaxID=1301915 RepID=A0A076LKT3_9EURY|nr:4Fe-4S ferredoxin [Methanocaldococcus bathoardescens]
MQQIKEVYNGIITISRNGIEKRELMWNDYLCVGCGICRVVYWEKLDLLL